ncbi:hypothetical protein [Streptosporangium sp. NBC_01756]|uniref:hypothetical protein n=1 Tax=Streptosporangium sp. NBC_01756 TaxID=2975950 RepID=UPI002DD98A38|nr:hypothetical protein [Streptosporangium sp. NBC_01756]WSC86045.1 hypothetical protein OIE48_37720 [Streptosporangium sp. NBC_01756]
MVADAEPEQVDHERAAPGQQRAGGDAGEVRRGAGAEAVLAELTWLRETLGSLEAWSGRTPT